MPHWIMIYGMGICAVTKKQHENEKRLREKGKNSGTKYPPTANLRANQGHLMGVQVGS